MEAQKKVAKFKKVSPDFITLWPKVGNILSTFSPKNVNEESKKK